MSNNLPVINNYKDLLEFNKSLEDKKYLTYNISGVKYAKNTIEVNGETVNIDRFLYDYIVNKSFILTGKLERLKQYDFSKLNYLLHPEFREEFVGKLRAYFNNVVMLGGSEVELWDFTLTIEGKDIILKRCNKARAEEVFIPAFITKIEGGAFCKITTTTYETYFKYLKKVTIEESSQLKTIGDDAFYCCTALERINLPEGLERIGTSAFYKCNFISVLIPSSVKVIKERAFEHSRQLRQVIFKNNSRLKVLEKYTFNGCNTLEEINLPSSLVKIDNCAFSSCMSLEKISLPDSVRVLGYAFTDCHGLKEVTLGKGVTAIPTCAFHYCESLTKVTALGNIDIISTSAFNVENIPEVYIPKTSKFEPSENDEEVYRAKIIKQ